MSRNGSGVYSLPAGSTITNGDTSTADDLNIPLADLETDMNTARPIVAGGTGATSLSAAQAAFKIPPFDGVATISGAWVRTGTETFNDSVALRLGTGADTTFLHNGTNTIITDASAGLIVKTASFKAQNAAGTEDMIEAVQDSFVKLRHNNTARLTTTSTGVDIVGLLNGDTIGGSMVSTSITTDTGSTTKVPHVSAVEAYASKKLTNATMQTASGASVDFTGIPAGTKEIVVMFNGVSLTGTDHILVQLGDSGGIETTGYASSSGDVSGESSSSSGLIIKQSGTAASTVHGSMILHLMDAATFLWSSLHGIIVAGGGAKSGGGTKALSDVLTQIRVTPSGANTFDAGTINIAYR